MCQVDRRRHLRLAIKFANVKSFHGTNGQPARKNSAHSRRVNFLPWFEVGLLGKKIQVQRRSQSADHPLARDDALLAGAFNAGGNLQIFIRAQKNDREVRADSAEEHTSELQSRSGISYALFW